VTTNIETIEIDSAQMSTDWPLDDVLEARAMLLNFKARMKEAEATMNANLVEWIEANGDITFGTKRLYVGHPKTTKCKNVGRAMLALFDACDGDFKEVANCMSINAIKHGAARGILEDQWDDHFTVTTKPAVKEGAAEKQLLETDSNYITR